MQKLSPGDGASGYVYYAGGGVGARVPATGAAVGANNCSSFEVRNATGDWHQVGQPAAANASAAAHSAATAATHSHVTPPWLGSGSVTWNDWAKRYIFMTGGDTESTDQVAGGSMHMASKT